MDDKSKVEILWNRGILLSNMSGGTEDKAQTGMLFAELGVGNPMSERELPV
jgi:hypothetical protein